MHYKLDHGIDHVLIDEAQDTSPKQWEIIRLLTAEFFAGAGARVVSRSIFAVGDEKQSIFSFQGAVPRTFAEMRDHFKREHAASELVFIRREFKHSFRSGENVLGAVDTVFREQAIYRSVTSEPAGVPPHEALPDKAPGLVEIWPLIKADPKTEIEAWDAPFDALAETSPQVQLAARIARQVKHWMERGVRAGDVLVLVRQRGALFEAIIRALKEADVAVAGADRLVLTEHIAVMDLMVLADALLLPDDDLALATVLKSPLFGFDDDDLFTIAWERKGSLRAALREKAPTGAALRTGGRDTRPLRTVGRARDTVRLLCAAARTRARTAEILRPARPRSRRRARRIPQSRARLREPRDAVAAGLHRLAAHGEDRRQARHGDRPRRGAGDDRARRQGPGGADRGPRRHHDAAGRAGAAPAEAPAGPGPARIAGRAGAVRLGRPQGHGFPGDHESAREHARRSRGRIPAAPLCGDDARHRPAGGVRLHGVQAAPEGCWYELVHDALEPNCTTEAHDLGDSEVWRYRKQRAADGGAASASQPSAQRQPLPDWLTRPVTRDAPTVQPLSPSRAYEDAKPVRAGTGADRAKALARGTLVHRLLQSLPEVAQASRAEAARDFLARAARSIRRGRTRRHGGAGVRRARRPALCRVVRSRAAAPRFRSSGA